MSQYIDIDRKGMTVNGEPVTEREMVKLANKIYSRPARYFCLLDSRHEGKFRYADFDHDSDGDDAAATER